MKLNAICMVKNEGDIILETLKNALLFCDNIYIFDNGSTDGTWESMVELSKREPRVILAERSDEVFKNQLRSRIYNRFHMQYSDDDWWYILDADELLDQSPKPMLERATKQKCDIMRVWQAQFYFTDKDLETYPSEDHSLSVSSRRKYYKINWREIRFFRNNASRQWDETDPGRIPSFCKKMFGPSPVCRHYAERTPEQIQSRIKSRKSNPYSFLHVKNRGDNDWLRKADDLDYHEPGHSLSLHFRDFLSYYLRELGYWLQYRVRNISNIVCVLQK